jgi:hypothetical protein
MPLTERQARDAIDKVVDGYRTAVPPGSIFSTKLAAGKTYEAWVLCKLLERLQADERYTVTLPASATVTLRSSHGGIDPAYPGFKLTKPGEPTLEVWTDVEFMTYSYSDRGSPRKPERGDFHELDVLVVPEGCTGRPKHSDVRIGVECKHTAYSKELLRAILGVRRELSLLVQAQPTGFGKWPRKEVPAHPPSCLLVYSTSPKVSLYSTPGWTFGINFIREDAPFHR